MRILLLGAFTLMCLINGSIYFIIARVITFFPPYFCAWFRYVVATIFYLIVHLHGYRTDPKFEQKISLITRKDIFNIFMLAVIWDLVGGGLMFLSQVKVASGIVSVIWMADPLVATFGSALFLPESMTSKLTLYRYLGLVIAIVGLVFTLSPSLFHLNPDYDSQLYSPEWWDVLLCVGAASCMGIGNIWAQRLSNQSPYFDRSMKMFGEMSFAALLTTPPMIITGFFPIPRYSSDDIEAGFSYLSDVPFEGWIYLFVLSVVATIMGITLYYYCMERIGPIVSFYAFLVPSLATVIGVVANNEWDNVGWLPKVLEVIGLVLTTVGSMIVLWPIIFAAKEPYVPINQDFADDDLIVNSYTAIES